MIYGLKMIHSSRNHGRKTKDKFILPDLYARHTFRSDSQASFRYNPGSGVH